MKPAKYIVSISLVLTIASVAAALAQQTPGAQVAAPNAGACDRLAASPYDKARPAGIQGMPLEQVDAPAAIEACRGALATRPDDARLAYQLARALDKNGGVEALTEAVHLYRFAADRGHPGAQYNLAIAFYESGRGGLPKDDGEAARLYRLAADQGLALAQSRLGFFYATGRGGLPKDDQEAAHLYKLAADQGNAVAQANLGFFYANGRGGLPKDDHEAARLYKLAADQGNAFAREKLAPKFETEPFSGSELLNGKQIAEHECADLAGAVWVVADGKGECIRYYHASAVGGADVLVFLNADLISVNGRGEAKPLEFYLRETAAALQKGSADWSRALQLPYVHLARPGTQGSSGEHNQRRTPREIELISAALDAIKSRHGYAHIHVAAYGEGAHAAAALLAKRSDLGCVVLASGLVSLHDVLTEHGRATDVTGNKTAIDPITVVDRIAKRPELRIFVVTDPDDVAISARSQTIYAKRLAAAGLPVRQIFTAASDPNAHALWRPAREIAANCAKGIADETIIATYQKKLPETPPDADDPPLHAADVLTRGLMRNEAQCKALAMALWVRAEGRNFCVRYWLSMAGGPKDEAQVFFNGDLGGRDKYRSTLRDDEARATAGGMLREALAWSRFTGGPYASVGRPGTFGSSGVHIRERRTPLEVRVVMATLDALKERYAFKQFHLVGQSGGGHTVAALTQLRNDIGCAVMASGVLSVKSRERDSGNQVGSLIRGLYDPIDHVSEMRPQEGRRMIVVTDPDDRTVSPRSQREFVERVRSRGLPILQITAAAGDEHFHALASVGRRVAADCAKGVDDETLVKRYQDKTGPVARRH